MLKYQYNKYVTSTTTIDFSCCFAQLPLPFFILQIRFDHSRLLLGENFKNELLHYFRIFSNACPGNGHTFVVYSGRLSHGHTNSRRTIHRSVPSCSCCCPDTPHSTSISEVRFTWFMAWECPNENRYCSEIAVYGFTHYLKNNFRLVKTAWHEIGGSIRTK